MAHTVEIVLGEKPYTINTLPYRDAKKWRATLEGPFNKLLSMLNQVESMNLQSIQDIVAFVKHAIPTLIQAPDEMFELLMGYSPTLERDREFIETTAIDEEIVVGFVQVIKLAFPLGHLMTSLGQGSSGTSKSSSVARGKPVPVASS